MNKSMETVVEPVLPGKYREPPTALRAVSAILPVIAMVYGLLYLTHVRPFGWVLYELSYLYLLFALFLPLVFVWIPASRKHRGNLPWYDFLFAVLSFGIPLYFSVMAKEISLGWGTDAPLHALVMGTALWALLIEAARRSVGSVFAVIVLFFSLYPLFSEYMPGPLWAPIVADFEELISYHTLGFESLMGIVTQIFGRILFGYLVFAVAIQLFGAGQFFGDLANVLLGRTRGGHAKTAIVASGLLGSVSGSPIANVLTTGAFTIPAMKKAGFPAPFAGAVEACASTGGSLMPPVMGAVAFIMAEFLQVSYAEVALVAVVPSLLYYLVLFVQIDLYAARVRLDPAEPDDQTLTTGRSIGGVLLDNLHILASLAVLVYVLFAMRMEAHAPWIATFVLFALSFLRRSTRLSAARFFRFLQDVGRVVAELLCVLGPLGFILGSLTVTGVAYALPYEIVKLAGGNLYFMLFMGAVACFILGMGVTMAATYIFLAIVLAPGLVDAGIDVMAAHLFVLYCGLWSHVTPPVAIVAFAAAGVAEAPPMKTGFMAMRLGIAKYLIPFFFVLSPAMIFRGGTLLESVHVITTCAVGLMMISMAFERYVWRLGPIKIVEAGVVFVAGILVAFPGTLSDVAGIALGGAILAEVYIRKHYFAGDRQSADMLGR